MSDDLDENEELLAELTATDDQGDGGLPYVPPLAQFGAERETVPGLLCGVQLVEGLAAPEVRDGLARIPSSPSTGGGSGQPVSIPLAQFKTPYQPDTAGLVSGIGVADPGVTDPSIQDGFAAIPLAQYTIPEHGERPGLIKGAAESEEVAYIEIHEGIIVHPQWVPWATYQDLLTRVAALESRAQTYAPSGLYDAVNARHISWAELKESGAVTISHSTQHGIGIKAFMIGDSLSIFLEE